MFINFLSNRTIIFLVISLNLIKQLNLQNFKRKKLLSDFSKTIKTI